MMADILAVTADDPKWPTKVRVFWFETFGPEVWFVKDTALDLKITTAFQSLYEDLIANSDQLHATTAADTLALIIVLDQFPRNMFRDTSRAFASDDLALRLAEEAIAMGFDKELAARECQFLYMPFQHSEDVSVQAQSIVLYERLGLDGALEFARRHKRVIDRFGRFPHRNNLFNRTSTATELSFLAEPGSSF